MNNLINIEVNGDIKFENAVSTNEQVVKIEIGKENLSESEDLLNFKKRRLGQ